MSRSFKFATLGCLVAIVLAVLLLAKPVPVLVAATPAPTAAMTAEDIRAFVDRWIKAGDEVLRTGNAQAFVNEYYSPNYVQHNQGTDPDSGFSGVVDTYNTMHVATSDFHTEVTDVLVEGNRFTILMVNHAVNTGPLPPLVSSPTNRKLQWKEMDICRIADGKIQECQQVWDSLALLTQLGFGLNPPKK